MRTGVVLPTFRQTPDQAFAAADEAVAGGVDGVFCYDHIWPMSQPERPALAPFPVLGALTARLAPNDDGRGGPFLGTLVARASALLPTTYWLRSSLRSRRWRPGASSPGSARATD